MKFSFLLIIESQTLPPIQLLKVLPAQPMSLCNFDIQKTCTSMTYCINPLTSLLKAESSPESLSLKHVITHGYFSFPFDLISKPKFFVYKSYLITICIMQNALLLALSIILVNSQVLFAISSLKCWTIYNNIPISDQSNFWPSTGFFLYIYN